MRTFDTSQYGFTCYTVKEDRVQSWEVADTIVEVLFKVELFSVESAWHIVSFGNAERTLAEIKLSNDPHDARLGEDIEDPELEKLVSNLNECRKEWHDAIRINDYPPLFYDSASG